MRFDERLQPVDDSWFEKPDGQVPTRVSSGGVVGRCQGDQVLVALVYEKRSRVWVLPKGGVESGESLLAAAHREVHEEAGFDSLTECGKLAVLERWSYDKRRWVETHVYLFQTDQVDGEPLDPEHPQPPQWFSLDELPQLFWPDQQRLLENRKAHIQEEIKKASDQSQGD